MTDATKHGRPAGVRLFPLAANRDTLTVAQLADLYVAAYKEGPRQLPPALSQRMG